MTARSSDSMFLFSLLTLCTLQIVFTITITYFVCYTLSQKNCTLLFLASLCQLWLDLNNSFTVVDTKYLHTNMESNLAHHLHYVATLPCKMHSAHHARETVDLL